MGSEYKRSKVGFPIRKSSDQSLFAAPQGLSQRTTSFIASQRQGIHRMLLRHLITLMIDVRRSAATDSIQKDHLLPNPSGSPEGDRTVREHACRTHPIPARQSHAGRWAIVSPNSRICSLFTISNIRRPLLQQRRIAFDTEHATSGGARRDRTDDLMLAKHALSQLSYGPEWSWVVCNPWWAWDDSNVRPHPYQGCALTT
jgi:hypothetical protein